MPRDGRKPTEAEILTAGVYNLGFIGMARGGDTGFMLDWWAERLERDCVLDPKRGFFVDQRWIDFAPGLVESFHILRDPGYNVAYWTRRPATCAAGARVGRSTAARCASSTSPASA